MANNKKKNGPPDNNTPKPPQKESYKPFKIGLLLERLVGERGMKLLDLVRKVGKTNSVAYKLKKRTYLTIPEMMFYSEVLDYNLFDEYQPKVTPKPDPRDEEIKKLRGYLEDMEELEKENEKLRDENRELRGQVKVLKAIVEKKED